MYIAFVRARVLGTNVDGGMYSPSFVDGGIAGAGHDLHLALNMRLPLVCTKVGVQDYICLGHAGLSQGSE